MGSGIQMGKIREAFQNMTLKKALITLAVMCLGVVCILTVITILKSSDIRQEILDSRPIYVSEYTVEDYASDNSVTLVDPKEFRFEPLSGENLIYYWIITVFMVALPVLYVIAGSMVMAKLYYKLKIQKPLMSLNNGVEHISEQDLDFKIEYTSNDELGKLCNAFECMKKEIYTSNRKMWNMLQERKALTASVSHDLRTPITVINGYLDYLDKVNHKQIITEEALRSTLKQMKGAVQRLERYVECVKDIQKIEDVEIKKEYFNLKEYITNTVNDFSLLAKKYGRVLEYQNQIKTESICSDKDMLSKILENIFDNALRFSEKVICFSITEKNNYVCFTIYDDGKGFSEDELKYATSFFYSSPTNKGNFGIGLSICKILCERLDCVLSLDNTAEHGASITVQVKE